MHRKCWINVSYVRGDGEAIHRGREHERRQTSGEKNDEFNSGYVNLICYGTATRQLITWGQSSEESCDSVRCYFIKGSVTGTFEQGPGRHEGAGPERKASR